MSAWPALIASKLTLDQKTQAHQSEKFSAFHCRTYMEMYSCSVCMFPQTTFMWEMSLCLASKISSRSTCLSGKAWVSNHNHPACKLVTPPWCCRFVHIQCAATVLHGHWPHGQKFACICIIAVTALWGLSLLSCCLCLDCWNVTDISSWVSCRNCCISWHGATAEPDVYPAMKTCSIGGTTLLRFQEKVVKQISLAFLRWMLTAHVHGNFCLGMW